MFMHTDAEMSVNDLHRMVSDLSGGRLAVEKRGAFCNLHTTSGQHAMQILLKGVQDVDAQNISDSVAAILCGAIG